VSIKQVLLVRTDLNMRKGKIAAQCAHGAMKVFLDQKTLAFRPPGEPTLLVVPLTPAMEAWVTGSFTKIVLGVETETELLRAHEEAVARGIPTALVTDMGATEFHGVPTNTVVALGPDEADKIDLVTGPGGLVKTKLL